MQIENVLIVLGKRLQGSKLTKEGYSRVSVLTEVIPTLNLSNTVIILCGGITNGQFVAEADAMKAFLKDTLPESVWEQLEGRLILESKSLNTIENIENAALALVEANLCKSGQNLKVTFLSNDYHLERIFEIQRLMDAQGLLQVLKQRCLQMGLSLDISLDLSSHIAVPYPDRSVQGKLFLTFDELSVYRVYLEGVVASRLNIEDVMLKAEIESMTRKTLDKLSQFELDEQTQRDVCCLLEPSHSFFSSPSLHLAKHALEIVHPLLTQLKDRFDPEVK